MFQLPSSCSCWASFSIEKPSPQVLEQTGGNRFSGPIDCFFKTVTESGALSLYRGLTAPLLGSMAECASLFTSYGYAKKVLGVNEEAGGVNAVCVAVLV